MLALAIGSVPAVFASDPPPPPTVKTIVSGGSDVVTYSIPSVPVSSPAVLVPPNTRYITELPGAKWINTSGSTGCDQGCDTTTIYSTSFELPATSSESLKIEIMADN